MSYFNELNSVLLKAEAGIQGKKPIPFGIAIKRVIKKIRGLNKKKNKLIFIGNGGSASIASHVATDSLKNAHIPALAFNDASLITCLSNDLGYEYVFQKPVELLSKKGDILFAISSSGRSKNILNAVKQAKKNACFLVTLSGFGKDNPLRRLGDINFYIPSDSYGFVEIAHLAICHCIFDRMINEKRGQATF